MPLMDTLTTVEGQTLDTVKQAQDTILGVAKTVADSVASYVPELPVTIPAEVPQPSVLVDNLFDFAGKLLAANREFTKQLLETVAPLAVVKPAPVVKAAAKPRVAA